MKWEPIRQYMQARGWHHRSCMEVQDGYHVILDALNPSSIYPPGELIDLGCPSVIDERELAAIVHTEMRVVVDASKIRLSLSRRFRLRLDLFGAGTVILRPHDFLWLRDPHRSVR